MGGLISKLLFLSFSNHENYSSKNIRVYRKNKMKTKVTNKQNLEHRTSIRDLRVDFLFRSA